MGGVLATLSLAFVMIAGPQIISAVFLATSPRWKSSSAAYVVGAVLSITIIVSAAYVVIRALKSSSGPSGDKHLNNAVDWIIVALLLVAAFHIYRGRRQAEPPKWMGKLQGATPRFAFMLGFLLLGVFPTDIATSVTVGCHLGREDKTWVECLPFVGLTALLLASPALLLLVVGKRAEAFLPKARDWMNANSWVISEGVIAFFIVITLA